MKPSLGRIVLYNDGSAIQVAIVVKVWENSKNNMVNLRVMGDNSSSPAWFTSISEGEGSNTWAWPPRV